MALSSFCEYDQGHNTFHSGLALPKTFLRSHGRSCAAELPFGIATVLLHACIIVGLPNLRCIGEHLSFSFESFQILIARSRLHVKLLWVQSEAVSYLVPPGHGCSGPTSPRRHIMHFE